MLKFVLLFFSLAIFTAVLFPRWLVYLPLSSEWLGPVKGIVSYKDYLVRGNVQVILEEHEYQLKESFRKVEPLTFIRLPQARICQTYGFVITNEDKLYADNANDWSYPTISDVKLLKRLLLPRVQKYYDTTVAVATTKGAECYYHWMTEVVPKLTMLKRMGISFDKVYLPPIRKPFQQESLKKLGIAEECWIEAKPTTMIKARETLVLSRPGATGWANHTIDPWIAADLRNLWLQEESPPTEHIYISRAKASRRRVCNEAELCELLKKYRFEVVYAEDLTIEEQAKKFNAAKLIIAPHGAALTNLVFTHPGIALIEFYHPEHDSDVYRVFTEMQGTKHYLLNLAPLENSNKDGFINLEEIEHLLQTLLSEAPQG